MLVMVYQTSLQLRRQICFLQKLVAVWSPIIVLACCYADCGLDLVVYCENENVPFKTFENFSEILDTLKKIVAGRISVKDVAAGGA
jgi:hypothetical protein